ncbi:MAG: hypothetical protein QOF63_348 [Thermoanaerobaculia bacterium]|jgi:hypothetical protein|nr:hypothetical protein [Thermoanaerobaculia bacterium]
MANPVTERREATRELLARTVVCLLCGIGAAIVALIVFGRALAIPSASVQIVERLFLGVLGLAALITRFYFTGRR